MPMDLQSINTNKMLIKYKPLIFKTLHRLRIHQHHMYFDDFFQELQIKLLSIYKEFEGDPLNVEEDSYKFTAFAGNGLYWRGIDLFKNKNFNTLPISEDEALEKIVNATADEENMLESNVFLREFMSEVRKKLTDSEYLLFSYLAEGDYTMTEIADLMAVSRGTLYNRRQNMQIKIEEFKFYLQKD